MKEIKMTKTRSDMASIAITQNNLSHFNKRLQKALKESLGVDVKLTLAADIFAKACGKSSTYEIQKILSIQANASSNEFINIVVDKQETIKSEVYEKSIKSLYLLSESKVLEIFKKSLNYLKTNCPNLSLELRKNDQKDVLHFIYFNEKKQALIPFNIPFENPELFHNPIEELIPRDNLPEFFYNQAVTHIKKFYDSIQNCFVYKELFISSIQNNYLKDKELKHTILFQYQYFRNLVEKDGDYYRLNFKILLEDIRYYDGSSRPFVFKELKPALKALNLYCHQNEHPEITFSISHECLTNKSKRFTEHYRLSNDTGKWIVIGNNETITLKDIKKIAEFALYGDHEKNKDFNLRKDKMDRTSRNSYMYRYFR